MKRGTAQIWLFIHALSFTALGIIPPCLAQTSKPAETVDTKSEIPQESSYNVFTTKKLTGNWFGLRDDLKDLGVDFSLSYQHQIQQNFRGGLDTHNAHRQTGTYDAVLKFDLDKMKLIDDAGFYFKFKGSWSESDFVGINGDKVGASGFARVNSDASDDHTIFVKKWWYWQKFADKKIELRLGMIETNKDLFDVSPYANHEDKDFLNRLSIRNATIPQRTGIGAFLRIAPVDWFYVHAAAVDAQSRDRRTGFDTACHDEAWYVGLWEFGFTPKWNSPKGPMPGRYRVGFWYDPRVSTVFDNSRVTTRRGDDVGFYVGLDQMIFKENDDAKDNQGLGLYARYGFAHRDINKVSNYWSSGLSYTGLIPTRDKDISAFGVSQAILSSQYRNEVNSRADRETVYEWYYKCYLTPWCILTPDLQVITNPGGTKDGRDAVVAGLRMRIIF